MSTAATETGPERYEELMQRLGALVERLEGGGLSLEEAISAFEEGMRMARSASARLDDAERRVELLLEGDRTQPFESQRGEGASTQRAASRRGEGSAG